MGHNSERENRGKDDGIGVKEIAGMEEGVGVGAEEGASMEVRPCHWPVAERSPRHGPKRDTMVGLAHDGWRLKRRCGWTASDQIR